MSMSDYVAGALNPRRKRESEFREFNLDRIQFNSEIREVVPGYLLLPKKVNGRLPVMICLQGHSPGMHLSIGQPRNDSERSSIMRGRDMAIQAVRHGWAALPLNKKVLELDL